MLGSAVVQTGGRFGVGVGVKVDVWVGVGVGVGLACWPGTDVLVGGGSATAGVALPAGGGDGGDAGGDVEVGTGKLPRYS